jgi:hypothetical protein
MKHPISFTAACLALAVAPSAALAAEEAASEAAAPSATTTEESAAQPADSEWKESFFTPAKKPPARMAIGINPVGLIFGLFIGEFDYGLSDQLSLNINGSYWNILDTTAWGVGVGAQYFISDVAASGPLYQGFYVYPSLQISSVDVSTSIFGIEASSSYVAVAPEVVAGWQIDWRPFTMRLGAGAAYYIGSAKDGFDSALSGFRFVADGTIGVTFGG